MPKFIDYTGYENEYLKIIRRATKEEEIELNKNNKHAAKYWVYVCKTCGSENFVSSQNVKKIKSCGCSRKYKNAENEIGNTYGQLTIIDIDRERTDYEYSQGHQLGVFYKCKCSCGNIKTYRLNSIKYGHIKSCGCSKFNNPLTVEDLTGKKFGRLTVIGRDIERDNKLRMQNKLTSTHWLCLCECGNMTSVTAYQLKSGHTKSCGCYVSEMMTKRNKECSSKINRPVKYKENYYNIKDNIVEIFDENMENSFFVDAQDYEYIMNWYWRKIKKGNNKNKWYWVTNAHKEDVENGYPNSIKLHQIIAERKYGKYDKNLVPDHLNRNPDDNTRKNLILKTNRENSKNRKKSIANTSGKTGVYKHGNKWYANITVDYKTIFLGSFDEFDDAVEARLKAEEKYGFTCDNIYPKQDI